ncbi:MAG: hypothetical protein GY711_31810 [bacterium]|nr:hypothetical protein [bacterium]
MSLSSRTFIAVLFLVISPEVTAQDQRWIQQVGTTDYDTGGIAVPDESGGVYLAGVTYGDLGGPNAGGKAVWLGRYDGAGTASGSANSGRAATTRCSTPCRTGRAECACSS